MEVFMRYLIWIRYGVYERAKEKAFEMGTQAIRTSKPLLGLNDSLSVCESSRNSFVNSLIFGHKMEENEASKGRRMIN
jgi:hypothetical protein